VAIGIKHFQPVLMPKGILKRTMDKASLSPEASLPKKVPEKELSQE